MKEPIYGTVVYVLTSDGQDGYADMNLISLWSLLDSNPKIRTVVIIDSVSYERLEKIAHPILSSEAEIRVVSCEETPGGWRNRFVKTQVRSLVSGSLLYLDADTLVRGDLADLFRMDTMVAGIPNHNGIGIASEIPASEREILAKNGWAQDLPVYANGGVLFMADCPQTHTFCALWHKRWQESSQTTKSHYDQPALNQALRESGVAFSWLDHRYNAQVHARPKTAEHAVIWHIYRSGRHPTPRNYLDYLIALQRSGSRDVRNQVSKCCVAPHPWMTSNPIDTFAVHHMMSGDRILNRVRWERLWLAREYQSLVKQAQRSLRAMCSTAWRAAWQRSEPPAS